MAALADGTFLLAVAGQPLVRLTPAGEATVIPIEGQPNLQVYDLATCAADPERWIALGVDTSTWAYAALVTADGGATWSDLPRAGFADDTAVAVELHPWDCDLAILASASGIVRATADGGGEWAELDVGDEVAVANMRVIRLEADLAAALVLWGQGGVTRVDLTTAPAE